MDSVEKRVDAPLVSIVILNYNGKRFLDPLFHSLRLCTYPNVEVILVDNCSSDGSVAYVQERYPEVRIHKNAKNYLYARGNNEGIRIAAGKYICLLNNDTEVDRGFIEPVIALLEADVRIGAAQPKILAVAKRDLLESAGGCGGYIDWLGYPFLRGRLFFTMEEDRGQYDSIQQIFWASGACIFLRREMLDDVGLIDEDFQLHQEEIDLCWRMQLSGWTVYAVPVSKIWHHGGGTLSYANPRKAYWNFRNNLFLIVKNLSLAGLLMRLPLRIPLDGVALLVELLKGQPRGAWSIVRAYLWLVTHLPLMLRKRRETQQSRKLPDRSVLSIIYPGSIVIEYFALGKKTFSALHFVNRLKCKVKVADPAVLDNFRPTGGE